jgi:hypothetical protein
MAAVAVFVLADARVEVGDGVTLSQRTSARVSSIVSVDRGANVSGMARNYRHTPPKRRAPVLAEPTPSRCERKIVFFLG